MGGAVISHGIATTPGSVKGYGPGDALTSYKQFELVVKVNLLGTYAVAQKVANLLLKNKPFDDDGERGIILTVSSVAGLDGALTAYGTSKGTILYCRPSLTCLCFIAGVVGLTLPLARELSSFGIRVMSIAPGMFGNIYYFDYFSSFLIKLQTIATPMTTPSNLEASSTKIEVSQQTNLFPTRYGKPHEFASLAVSVIQSPMLNGSVIRLDGGLRI